MSLSESSSVSSSMNSPYPVTQLSARSSEAGTQLFLENAALNALAKQFGTPLYVYSTQALTDALGQYQHAFAALNPLICYAVKANSNLSILRHFTRLGCGRVPCRRFDSMAAARCFATLNF